MKKLGDKKLFYLVEEKSENENFNLSKLTYIPLSKKSFLVKKESKQSTTKKKNKTNHTKYIKTKIMPN